MMGLHSKIGFFIEDTQRMLYFHSQHNLSITSDQHSRDLYKDGTTLKDRN
jgi:hypothetical protein